MAAMHRAHKHADAATSRRPRSVSGASIAPPRHDAARRAALPWTLADIPYARIDRDGVRERIDLLCLLAGTSFIEFASDTYAANLADYCSDDADVAAWLSTRWEAEEVQHGRALRTYVEHVWPEFDWSRAYDAFYAEYSRTCGVESYAPTRALEMAARCVVETGTATCYRALRELTDEPVLRQIAERIRCDEVRHYRHFLHALERYDRREREPRLRIGIAMWRRLVEARRGDAEIGLWHAYAHVRPGERRDGARYAVLRAGVARAMRAHFPVAQAVRMLLKPLRLPRGVSLLLRVPLAAALRIALLR